ncbi:MAG TPA: carboxymuconolactone decarboxylase family protein [Gammaproteobacteria bacterium]
MNRYQRPLESEFSKDQQRVAEAITGGLRGDIPGPLLVWLRQPGLADRAQRLGEYCRYGTSLRTELVEIAILCVARVWGSEFEWHAHKRIALEKGVRPEIIESIRKAQRPQWETREQEIVFDFSYAVLTDRAVGDDLFETAVGALGIDTVVDLVGILGYYSMISMTINVFDVPLPDGATPELT